ncbi:MAG: monovalent cation:proton antiporter-2 (CPA2) family protein [Hyphomicrobiaceae bacterium]|nr:monovalent cation:proton antiporter-2 (CPA2) family protein [Hyphomicrobiaceae bacterium]
MTGNFLIQAAVFLAAAAIAAPIAKKLNISSVIGYLAAGVLIGPFGLGFVYAVYQVESILHIAEYGVALLLFLIGLELKPKRLWTMRGSVFGLGGSQVVISAVLLTPAIALMGVPWDDAMLIGVALALSSTAFVLQVLEEKGELRLRHGRAAFSVLLFQDIAAIPLIAMVPLLGAGGTDEGISLMKIVYAVGAIWVVVVMGRYALSRIYRLVAQTGVREAMTASALLTVVGVVLLMEVAGLSAALGAFLAGALLADSPYRHQIEADIAPFEGLLLGLFFTAVGMALNLQLLIDKFGLVMACVVGLLFIKAIVLYVLGRWHGLDNAGARRLALAVSQGGEFAFVIFTTALGENVIGRDLAELLTVIVTLSMLATPLLLLADDLLTRAGQPDGRPFDEIPEEQGHVVIAGFGRIGQIVARILQARGIPFTALDGSPEQIDLVTKFGGKAYYGDATRLSILEAAQLDKARAFVLAIGDVDISLKTAQLVRRHFPDVPIYARARNRNHVHQLMDLGIETIRRETFLSSLDITREVLRGLGYPEQDVEHTVDTFRELDRRHLYDDYEHFTDEQKLQERARERSDELKELFAQDESDLGSASSRSDIT